MKCLKNSVNIYQPITNNQGKKINYNNTDILAIASIGGVTTYEARGGWVDEGTLYNDSLQVRQFNYDDSLSKKQIKALDNLIKAIFELGQQLAVSVEVNNKLYILDSINDIELINNTINDSITLHN